MTFLKYPWNNKIATGVGYRSELFEDINSIINLVDFVEINTVTRIPDSIVFEYQKISDRIPLVQHSLDLSIGSDEEFDSTSLSAASRYVNLFNPQWFSEHLSFSKTGDTKVESFVPLPNTYETIEVLRKKLSILKEQLNVPVIVENVTSKFRWNNSDFESEAAFLNTLMSECDCGILLDITNLYINSIYHDYDPYEFFSELDRERISEIHVAGFSETPNGPVDSHVGNISNDIANLLQWTLKNSGCKAVLIERDSQLSSISDMMSDIEIVQECCNSAMG